MTLVIPGLLLFGYLIGSIPFSAMITHWRTGQDLYQVGEGNVGARNVWHVVGPTWGILAGLLDGLKGWATYVVSSAVVHASMPAILMSGFGVALGHQFPLYRGGRGGKGLAAIEGFLLGLAPVPASLGLLALVVAYAVTHDANFSVIFGPVAIVGSAVALHQSHVIVAVLGFGVLAGMKKLLDLPHERQVWSLHPWQGTHDKPAIGVDGPEDDPDLAQVGEDD
jgi:acyl phosphate:glycerol-3-phosphate acyltransferase